MKPADRQPATLAAHASGYTDPIHGAIVPPIQPSTTYERDPDYQLINRARLYSRPDNPNYEPCEQLLTQLEGGAGSLLFSSGMSAATAVFLALQPGDHVIAPPVFYWALRNWLFDWATRWGLKVETVDTAQPALVAAAMRKGATKLVWIETPANPSLAIADISALAEIAHAAGARLAVDSTFATPVLSQPIALGADLVMHSATKYLNGHSDVVAGTLTTRTDDDFWKRLKLGRAQGGAVLGPFEAWLLLRGMRTLFVRVHAQSKNGQLIAEKFVNHAAVKAVLYPGLASHPGHAIAARQMHGGFGGMLSLRVHGGAPAALKLVRRVQFWKRATSLGGVESLIEHRASVESPGSGTPDDLLRLSTGIEDAGDLIADLEQALS